jgi:hypothetical protein
MSWKDRHSVTCVLCGGLADERRTQDIWPSEVDPATRNENPEFYRNIQEIADTLGKGEAHQECFEHILESDINPNRAELESKDHR